MVAPLFYAQELTGQSGRVSRILVEPAAGREAAVRSALVRLAAGRLNVQRTSYDETLFAKAAEASNQSTALFAVISAMVGFLFAFNAMLLTVGQRRRLIGDLRRDGYAPRTVIGVLLLDAIVLGLAACVLGLFLGDELSVHLFRENPGYLGSAFSVGTQRSVGWQSIAIAIAGGMAAALIAVLSPLKDIVSRDPLAALTPKEGTGAESTSMRTALGGSMCLGAASAILIGAPKLAVLGMILLVGALVLVLPGVLSVGIALLTKIARRRTGAVGHVGGDGAQSGEEQGDRRGRYGSDRGIRGCGDSGSACRPAEGAPECGERRERIHGHLGSAARRLQPPAHCAHCTEGDRSSALRTSSGTSLEADEHVPGVAGVRIYRGGLLELGREKGLGHRPCRRGQPTVARVADPRRRKPKMRPDAFGKAVGW